MLPSWLIYLSSKDYVQSLEAKEEQQGKEEEEWMLLDLQTVGSRRVVEMRELKNAREKEEEEWESVEDVVVGSERIRSLSTRRLGTALVGLFETGVGALLLSTASGAVALSVGVDTIKIALFNPDDELTGWDFAYGTMKGAVGAGMSGSILCSSLTPNAPMVVRAATASGLSSVIRELLDRKVAVVSFSDREDQSLAKVATVGVLMGSASRRAVEVGEEILLESIVNKVLSN